MSFEINAQKRTTQGSGASRRLRRAAKVPAIVYGSNAEPQMIEIDHNEIYLALRKEAFHSSIITLIIDGAKEPVLLRDTQMHPYKRLVMHIDFQRINAKEKLRLKVPLHFVGAENAPGVKLADGAIHHIVNEIEVTCLPADLPEFIEIDLSNLNIGQSVHSSELKLPAGVEIAGHGTEDPVLVTLVSKKGGSEEGTEGAEGEEAGTPAST